MSWLRRRGDGGNPLPRATLPALATRAIVAARRAREDPADRAWVMTILTPPELALWNEQPEYDRRHAVRVAKRVERRLARTRYGGDTRWLSAALMHDVGKIRSDLSLLERVVATLASKFVGVATARRWARSAAGRKRRIGLYLIHAEIGAELIRAAGGRDEVAAWAEAHQGDRDFAGAGIPSPVVEALVGSDEG